ncbi:MAG: FAD-binding oxidoreductase, partial [Acidimicrobiia bacterium]
MSVSEHELPPIPFSVEAAEVKPRIEDSVLVDGLVDALRADGIEVSTSLEERTNESRDWWPLSIVWALDNTTGARAGAIVRPKNTEEVSVVLRRCNETRTPVVAAGGRSGVSGGVVPVQGGVLLDLRALEGVIDVDTTSMILDVRAGTFGDDLEATLQSEHGVTVGHWPQSMSLATVGGWLACRGAGQLSTRYGKIEDIVLGLDVVLANGE